MSHERIDWSQLWYAGPTRVFSDAELARAGGDRPSRNLLMVLAANLLGCGVVAIQLVEPELRACALGLGVLGLLPIWRGAMWLWARPTRRRLLQLSLAAMIGFVLLMLASRWVLTDRTLAQALVGTCGALVLLATFGYWLLAHFRAHQIEARLRELEERERAVAMARRLATAQIQPHFLFNSLASLQHWVDTGDSRAGPMLASLTGYLRAVLPLFQREQLALGEELGAVQRYLEVMQARLGERLRFAIEADDEARAVRLPPGLLLTLVENAIEHGVEPSLQGAELRIQARAVPQAEGRMLTLEVSDSGAGLPEPLTEGLGLANSRQRLAQACGPRARLVLGPRPGGGTIARLELPLPP